MTEPRAGYATTAAPATDTTYRCPRCNERLGHFVTLDNGGRILLIGGMIMLLHHSICGRCGNELYWRAKDAPEDEIKAQIDAEQIQTT